MTRFAVLRLSLQASTTPLYIDVSLTQWWTVPGNIAIGNLHLFLPTIVKLVQTDEEKRLPALQALKEVVSNCPPQHLENVAETIWVPLFQNSANSEESTRNVAAACLGKLTTTNASRYLPQLQVSFRP